MNKINVKLLKKFIEDSHKSCKFCNLKGTVLTEQISTISCVGRMCRFIVCSTVLYEERGIAKKIISDWVIQSSILTR